MRNLHQSRNKSVNLQILKAEKLVLLLTYGLQELEGIDLHMPLMLISELSPMYAVPQFQEGGGLLPSTVRR